MFIVQLKIIDNRYLFQSPFVFYIFFMALHNIIMKYNILHNIIGVYIIQYNNVYNYLCVMKKYIFYYILLLIDWICITVLETAVNTDFFLWYYIEIHQTLISFYLIFTNSTFILDDKQINNFFDIFLLYRSLVNVLWYNIFVFFFIVIL